MAIPTEKATPIENLINNLSPQSTTRKESITGNICSWCGESAEEFEDDLSRKEYRISGMCQACQDGVFDA